MNAAQVVEAIGEGVVAALRTNTLFLGIEEFATRNADIHPEYITTLKVAEQLTGVDRVVALEVSMKALRKDARGLARLKSLSSSRSSWPAIDAALKASSYDFGKERIDILVREASTERPPLLMVEAKLGVRNIAGVIKDIGRIVNLFQMYDDVGVLATHDVYGAVVFHAMEEEGTGTTLRAYTVGLLSKINNHLAGLRRQKPNLFFNAGLLSATLIEEPVSGYREELEDGTINNMFEKDRFAFQAGIVLIGTAADVTTIQL